MPCTNPQHAWMPLGYTKNGKMAPTFKFEEGNKYEPILLPCSKCVGCKQDAKRNWGVRCYHEAQSHKQSSFLTLTYRDPPPDKISKHDLVCFIKRLRKHYPLRYFGCGEYGERTKRPHYHLLIFGQDFLTPAKYVAEAGRDKYINAEVEKIWGHGQVIISPASPERCFYAAGYCLKKAGETDTFAIQSRMPPIGKPWLEQHWDNLRRIGFVIIEGRKITIPPVYFKWMEQELEPVKLNRRQYVAKQTPLRKYTKLKSGIHRDINLKAKYNGKADI